MVNEILLRRKNQLLVEKGTAVGTDTRYVEALLRELQPLGYTVSKELAEVLLTFSRGEWKQFYPELMKALKQLRGADVSYQPMYPNFPDGVMQDKGIGLYWNAVLHYISDGHWYPLQENETRLPFVDKGKPEVLGMGSREELMKIFQQLVSANSSISEQDSEDIRWFFEHVPDIRQYLPEELPLKENAALVGMLYITYDPLAEAAELYPYFKTATDVLRLAAAMSGGDISLADNTRFKSFTRRERRILLALLEHCHALEEDMLRSRERFIRLGERLHPGEYAKQYARTAAVFSALRNGEGIRTYGGKLALAIGEGDYQQALMLLGKRPGEFARRLDHMVRIHPQPEQVVCAFSKVADQVSTTVLLQAREHFLHRGETTIRTYLPKGKLAQIRQIDALLPPIDRALCSELVDICSDTLVVRFRSREPMGKVYVADTMRHYIVPFSQRSASKTVRTMVRGSRIPLAKEARAVRGFIWWTNETDGKRVDIDLSAAVFDEDFRYMEHISYTKLRSEKYRACHSGDIVNGGPATGTGASEFLDVDIDTVVSCGARYVVYQIYSFTRQNFAELPNIRFGMMEREDVSSGEIFEPASVKQKMDITSNSSVAIPVIYDCKRREMIWCDMNLALANARCGGNNLESNLSGVSLACYSMAHMHKPSVYDLISLHVAARGSFCEDREEADLVFDEEEGITPFDTEVFLSEYLA